MNTVIFRALAEPKRLQIVEYLREKPRAVGEIADYICMRQPQTSKHLRVLSDAGLVQVHPVANRRIYALREEPLRELDDWLDQFRRVWEEKFDQLDDYLNELQARETDGGEK